MKQILSACVLGILIAASCLPAGAEPLAGSALQLDTGQGVMDLASLRGNVVYLDFWASWCGPCRKSFPWMNAMHRKYAGEGLVILAVNEDNERHEAERFLEKIPADFRIAYDRDGALAATIKLAAMPSSYIIAADGQLFARHLGFKEKEQDRYESAIRAALGLDEKATADTTEITQ